MTDTTESGFTQATAPVFDLRGLLQQRKSTDSRPIVRYAVCLVPELLSDLGELEEAKNDAVLEERRRKADDQPSDATYGDVSPLLALKERITALEAQIADVSVVVVCKALSQDAYVQLLKDNEKRSAMEIDPVTIRTTFSHFERDGQRIPGGSEELNEFLMVASRAEVQTLAQKIGQASTGKVELPFSVRQSLDRRR
ncbi:hypothetical protein [Auraticoccus monumenti]|uniref:Uncharacterized protein n=1 Tax=Auraticoccus monumenti TaxID=675864 RepID=A0A1G6UHH3_9ACTN|nr:hypothetical protein [Auraticoccus monumenti]SDD40828.1 hypothetical protein SAMN04489747_0888 [Auraticoccus monumenti]